MSSNRLIYDKCAYMTELKESVSPLDYNLFIDKYELSDPCPVGDYPNILKFSDRTNVENELNGLARLNTKCPENKYSPNMEFDNPKLSNPRLCESIHYITPNNIPKVLSEELKSSWSNCSKVNEEFSNISAEDDDTMYASCHSIIDNLNLGVNTCNVSTRFGNETKNVPISESNLENFANTRNQKKECEADSILNKNNKCVKCGFPLVADHKLNKCICGGKYKLVKGVCVEK